MKVEELVTLESEALTKVTPWVKYIHLVKMSPVSCKQQKMYTHCLSFAVSPASLCE